MILHDRIRLTVRILLVPFIRAILLTGRQYAGDLLQGREKRMINANF
jgi:hypothetical protein